jgi:non-heme chloroperoxidase
LLVSAVSPLMLKTEADP